MGFVTTLHVLTRRVAVLFIVRLAQLQERTSYVFLCCACLHDQHNHKRVHAVAILGKHDTLSFLLFSSVDAALGLSLHSWPQRDSQPPWCLSASARGASSG